MARLKKFKFELIDDFGPWCWATNLQIYKSTKGRCGMSAGGRKEGAVTGGGRWERGSHRSVPDLVLVALLHMCG